MNPQDDFTHDIGADRAWSESYYFNFYDPREGVGMFTRMALRPNEGWCDGLHAVYLGGDRVAFTYGREDLPSMTDRLQVGGLRLERIEPFRRWAVIYDGPAQDIADAAILITRRRERPEGWFRAARLQMRVEFDALAEPFYAAQGARGHFEQTGAVHGSIALDGRTWNVNGWGVRDKSWGPRTWQSGGGSGSGRPRPSAAGPWPFTTWFSANWGPDLALAFTCVRAPDGILRGSGWVQAGGKTQELRDVTVSNSAYRPNSILHTAMHIKASAADGTGYSIEGETITVCPTKIPMASGATFVNEGLARFRIGDRTGYGIAEFWHAVDAAE